MQFSLVQTALAVAVNLACVLLMLYAQSVDDARGRLPMRRSLIPGTRQEFLYMQDFWTMTWGDVIGLSSIAVTFAHLVVGGFVAEWQWVVGGVLGVAGAIGFLLGCLRDIHKPDWGYHKRHKVSLGGASHLPYFAAGLAMAAICLWHLVWLWREPVMWVGALGGVVYVVTFVLDIIDGNFDPLKPVGR